MAQYKTHEHGVVPLLILAVLAIVLVVAIGSWYLATGSDSKEDKKSTQSAVTEPPKNNSKQTPNQSVIQLAHKTVRLSLPKKWTYTQAADECPASATAEVVCLEGATVTPGVLLPTRYGDGTEYFHIQIGVFEGAARQTAKDWFVKDFEDGESGDQDTSKLTTINGYDAYYRKKKTSGDGTAIEEVSYAFSNAGKIVLIRARTYEPGTLADGRQVGDFRQFETSIQQMAESISIVT